MRRALPIVIWSVAAILLIAATVRFAVRDPRTDPAAGPEEAVYRAFDRARTGDVNGYLDCFAPPLSKTLGKTRSEIGTEAFSRTLRQRTESVTGIAVTRPDEQPDDPQTGVLLVEIVFPDRNETQEYKLRKARRGTWRIADIGPAKTVAMPIPYGTPVIPEDAFKRDSAAPDDASQ